MPWKDYIDESEAIQALFEYEMAGGVYKAIGATSKRNFCYKDVRNEEKFVTSQKAISHIEYGEWRMPIRVWLSLIFNFFTSLASFTFTSLNWFSVLSFIGPCIFLALAIYYYKFEFMISAVGSEMFHIISRKKSVLGDIQSFIKTLHIKKQIGLNASEEYITSNYYDKLINRFLFLLTLETSFFVGLAADIAFDIFFTF